MSFYFDASVLVAAIVEEPGSAAARTTLRRPAGEIIIGAFAAAEVAAAVSRGFRIGRFTEAEARSALEDMDALRVAGVNFAPAPDTIELAAHMARDFATKLLASDALHLASAVEAGATLVTFDRRLAAAAMKFGIDVVVPG